MAHVQAPSVPTAVPGAVAPSLRVERVLSIDAFRGLVMTLMLAEVLHLSGVVKAFPDSAFWSVVAFHTSHVSWQGCSLHDLIQPGFSFLVGAALPFSIAARRAKGQSVSRMLGHAAWRAALLVFLGVFLRSLGKPQTNFTFEDTLSQIGLGYVFLFLLGLARVRIQVAALVLILVGYWGFFAFHPAPGPDFNYPSVGVPADWPHHYSGFLSHWDKNSNAAAAFDRWFLNLFPRPQPFLFNGGGYSTLSFVPTLATMLIGLLAGTWLKRPGPPWEKLRGLATAGAALVLAGLMLQWTGICPIVKRIWTPAFTLFSGGCVVLILAGFYAAMEWKKRQRWAFPLLVVGANSIAAYLMSWTIERFFLDALNRHLGPAAFTVLGAPFEPVLRGVAVLAIFWSILYWMYRRKTFLRI